MKEKEKQIMEHIINSITIKTTNNNINIINNNLINNIINN